MTPPRRPLTRSLLLALPALLAAFASPGCGERRDRQPVYSGTIEAVEVDVVPEVSGRILERPVDQGDRVKAGDVVARIDARPYENALAETEGALAEARARLALVRSGYRKEEIESAARDVDEAEAQVTLAEAQVRRVRDLFAQQVIAQEEVDRAQRDLDVARARLASARARLLRVQRGNRPEEIAQAAAEVARLESVLAQRRLELERTTVRSPLEGTVTEKIQEAGEYARPGSPIVSVADLTHLYVWVYLDTIEKGRAQVGQAVAVKVDAWPDRRFDGRVVYISAEAEFTPRNVQTPEDRVQLVYGVKVAVSNEDGALKAGLPADVVLGAAAPSPAPS
ncbi:MAG: HlyD family secretion protein [Candidatus Polarisedimenticolia bacterium]